MVNENFNLIYLSDYDDVLLCKIREWFKPELEEVEYVIETKYYSANLKTTLQEEAADCLLFAHKDTSTDIDWFNQDKNRISPKAVHVFLDGEELDEPVLQLLIEHQVCFVFVQTDSWNEVFFSLQSFEWPHMTIRGKSDASMFEFETLLNQIQSLSDSFTTPQERKDAASKIMLQLIGDDE